LRCSVASRIARGWSGDRARSPSRISPDAIR
jgi:hypothetical protein